MQMISIIVQKCRICKVFFARKIPIAEINSIIAEIVNGKRVSISVFITKLHNEIFLHNFVYIKKQLQVNILWYHECYKILVHYV